MKMTKRKASRPDTPPVPRHSGETQPAQNEDTSVGREGENAVIAEESERKTLRDAAGTPLFQLTILSGGRVYIEPHGDLQARLVRLGWKVGKDVQEVARAFYWLSRLQTNDVQHLFENLLTHVACSEPMVRLKGAFDPMTAHLTDDLGVVADDQKPPKERQAAAQAVKKRLCDAVDALLHGAAKMPHRNAKQIFEVPVAGGEVAKMPWEVAAIQETLKFAAVHRRTPSIGELRKEVEKRLETKISVQRFGDVLARAELHLAKAPPVQERKKGRLDELRAKSGKSP
jgi:hypothetical protein